jgi:hypothetical protein
LLEYASIPTSGERTEEISSSHASSSTRPAVKNKLKDKVFMALG